MTDNVKVSNIKDYLNNLSPDHLELITTLRELIKDTVPEAEEKILWSTPWYYLAGKLFVYLADNKSHINFGFAYGANLKSDLLEGTGKNMRHIKIRIGEEIDTGNLKELLTQAAKLSGQDRNN